MILILVCLFGLLLSHSASELSSLNFDDFNHLRGQVCYRTFSRISEIMSSTDDFRDYPKKPAEVSPNSPCSGMIATCCLPRKEVEIMPYVKMVYHEKLQSALDRRLASSCKVMGRAFEKSLYGNLQKSIELLRAEIAGITNEIVPQNFLSYFSDFLYKFVYSRDFCPLTDIVNKQIKDIFNVVLQAKRRQDSTLDSLVTDDCIMALESYYLNKWYNITLQNMIQSLNNIRLISETFELVKSIVNDIRKHRWSYPCVKALFKINHCAYCTGYKDIYPCDGNCINTMRGCTSDMAELSPFIRQLRVTLKKLGQIAHREFHPIRLLQSTMIPLVQLMHHLRQTDFKNIIQTNHCQVDENKDLQLLQNLDRVKLPQYVTKASDITNGLLGSLQVDMSCLNNLELLLLQLPEEMCGINPHHLAYIRKHDCWNGQSRGSYMHPIAGHYKKDQYLNPAFMNDSLPTNNSFQGQISNIRLLEHDINQTLLYYQCLERDDEDCKTKFVLYCDKIPDVDDITTGSGSGSGSGSGNYGNQVGGNLNGLSDTDDKSGTEVIIIVGGKRRFHEFEAPPSSSLFSSHLATPTVKPTTAHQIISTINTLTTKGAILSSTLTTTSSTPALEPSTLVVKQESSSLIISSTLTVILIMVAMARILMI